MKISYVKFRCTIEEKTDIFQKANKANLTMSDYCRALIMIGDVKQVPKLTPDEVIYFKNLLRFQSNFARISSFMKYKNPELTQEIINLLNQMRQLNSRFFPKK